MECIVAALVIGGCTALGALAVRWRRRRARAATPSPPGAPPLVPDCAPTSDGRGLDELFPGDVVLHDGMDLIVTGIGNLADGPQRWCECRLEDGERERWLIVRDDDSQHVVVGQRLPPDELAGEPSNSLEHAGQIYTLSRCGHASVSSVGELAGALATGDCRYWDYSRPGADRLWIRHATGFAGQRVPRHLITLLPGS